MVRTTLSNTHFVIFILKLKDFILTINHTYASVLYTYSKSNNVCLKYKQNPIIEIVMC